MFKRFVTHTMVIVILLSNTACRANDMADTARRDFILGGDHGWVDLVLMPAAGAVSDKSCALFVAMGNEKLIESFVSMPAGEAAPPIGFRIPVPVGKFPIALTVSGCVKEELTVKVPLAMEKDQLARLEFDGAQLRVASTTRFDPATLDRVSTDVVKLHDANAEAASAMAELKTFAKGSLLLNGLLLLAVLAGFLLRRRRPPTP